MTIIVFSSVYINICMSSGDQPAKCIIRLIWYNACMIVDNPIENDKIRFVHTQPKREVL